MRIRTPLQPLPPVLLLLLCGFLAAIVIGAAGCASVDPNVAKTSPTPTLFIVGDSTVRNSTRGQMGWGDCIGRFFDPARIRVENRARGGRSSRTFQTEGLWEQVLARANPGDFILIQFGHNDCGALDDTNRARGTIKGLGEESREIYNPIMQKREVVHTYGWYMRRYITDSRAKGVTPIIVSPVPRGPRQPVQAGDVDRNDYVGWSGEVARSEGAFFVDANRITMSRYVGMTPQQIKAAYFTPADNTHTSPAGADLNAASVVEGLRALKRCSLTRYLLKEPAPVRSAASAALP